MHQLAAALAEGLHAIHSRGLVHRDLKPLNIIMADDGPRIIDFGIAKAAGASSDPRLTATGAIVGTPAFLSPEQLDGSPGRLLLALVPVPEAMNPRTGFTWTSGPVISKPDRLSTWE